MPSSAVAPCASSRTSGREPGGDEVHPVGRGSGVSPEITLTRPATATTSARIRASRCRRRWSWAGSGPLTVGVATAAPRADDADKADHPTRSGSRNSGTGRLTIAVGSRYSDDSATRLSVLRLDRRPRAPPRSRPTMARPSPAPLQAARPVRPRESLERPRARRAPAGSPGRRRGPRATPARPRRSPTTISTRVAAYRHAFSRMLVTARSRAAASPRTTAWPSVPISIDPSAPARRTDCDRRGRDVAEIDLGPRLGRRSCGSARGRGGPS